MYASCVNKDPGNLQYVEAFMSNLEQKFKNNKKGERFRGHRSDFKNAIAEKNWSEVIEHGLELLRHNPWDHTTLRPMAEACASLSLNEVELRYLKNALTGNPKDIEINRHCATSLARMGQFDQAIACWHRIEELSKAHKPEARKMISQLTMQKTRIATGMTEEELTGVESSSTSSGQQRTSNARATESSRPATASAEQPTEARNQGLAAEPHEDPVTVTAEEKEKYEDAIVSDPAEVSNYLQLAKLHQADGDLAAAQEVLTRASSVSGNSLQVQEQLETVHLLAARRELVAAEQALKKKPKDAKLQQNVERHQESLNRIELDYYGRRTQRYPENNTLKYELALRLKRARSYAEAGKYFAEASQEEKLLPLAKLNQGECLQQTRQYRDALACYELAAEKALELDQIQAYKLSLYRAGMLATGLKDADEAIRLFEQLAGLDAGFRDVQLRLDKARKMRQTK
jgi:tetratricopeptide (TPR) repeat protein